MNLYLTWIPILIILSKLNYLNPLIILCVTLNIWCLTNQNINHSFNGSFNQWKWKKTLLKGCTACFTHSLYLLFLMANILLAYLR